MEKRAARAIRRDSILALSRKVRNAPENTPATIDLSVTMDAARKSG